MIARSRVCSLLCAASVTLARGIAAKAFAEPMQGIDSVALMRNISVLAADSMEGRRTDTAGGGHARAFILRQFGAFGVSPLSLRFTYEFSVPRAGGELKGVNCVGVIRGTKFPDRYIVLSAHYDHLGVRDKVVFNGADDNASGTAGVLAIAQWLRKNPPQNSVMIVLFDGEEAGLAGSLAFINQPPVPLEQIAANVNLDMIGRNAKGELWAAGATPWPVMKPILDPVVAAAPVTLKLGHDNGSGQNNWTMQSDQGPFHQKKIPFVYFGVEDHADYHKATDKVEKIMPGFYVNSVRTIAEFVRRLDLGLNAVAAVRAAGASGVTRVP